MPAFQSKPFRPSSAPKATLGDRIAAAYRARLNRHPFLLFGLPFIAVIVSASFVLTPATALRYERHDRKSRQLNDMDKLGLGKGARRVSEFNIQEEYQKLAAKDLENWEQKRVKRLPGEPDGVL